MGLGIELLLLVVFLRYEVNYDKLIVVFNTDEWPLKGLLAVSLDTSFLLKVQFEK